MCVSAISSAVPKFQFQINSIPNFSTVTTVFQNTMVSLTAFTGVAVAAVSSHIIPITIGVVGLGVALVLLWKKVYGAQEAPAAQIPPAAPAPAEAAKEAAAAPVHPAPAAPVVGVHRQEVLEFVKGLGIPEVYALQDNQYKTHGKKDKVVTKDGQHYCQFTEQHDVFEEGKLYPIQAWMQGKKGHNVYLILEKPAGVAATSSAPNTPRPAEATQTEAPKLQRRRTGAKIKVTK